jgi:aminoglycoside/choline kinase family phosphotransferase
VTVAGDVLDSLRDEGALDGLDFDPGSVARALRGHASTRRFYRLAAPSGASAILMVYPSTDAPEEIARFVRSTQWYRKAGVRVPEVFQAGNRSVIVADLGDILLEAADAGSRERLYRQAFQAVAAIQRRGERLAGPNEDWCLDSDRFRFELDFFEEHTMQGWLGARPAAARRQLYADVAGRLDALPRAICHRDFHCRNALVHHERLWWVDHQDTMTGPVYYDAVSLLLDNYVDVPETLWAACLRLLPRHGAPSRVPDAGLGVPDWPRGLGPADRQAFVLTALERSLKALGTFGYQITRRDRADYAAYVPRTWRHVGRALDSLGWASRRQEFAAIHAALA